MENFEGKATYALIIEPEKRVSFRVEKLRDSLRSEFNIIPNPYYKPHISLLDFQQYYSYEPKILPALLSFVSRIKPFLLTLNGFGTFGHTIYLKLKPVPKDLNDLSGKSKELKDLVKASVSTQSTYHLTILKDLNPAAGESVWTEYQKKHFEDFFKVTEFVLLRKKENQRHYLEVARLALNEKAVQFYQGSLFD